MGGSDTAMSLSECLGDERSQGGYRSNDNPNIKLDNGP